MVRVDFNLLEPNRTRQGLTGSTGALSAAPGSDRGRRLHALPKRAGGRAESAPMRPNGVYMPPEPGNITSTKWWFSTSMLVGV